MVEKPARILVVDDNEDDHVHLRRLLRSEFQVVAAYSAAEALERARSEAFDALITDQKMPRTSGDELIAAIKADERTQRLPCILLSGRTSAEQLVNILRGGKVFRYLDKNETMLTPDGQAEFLQTLRHATSQSRLERERASLTERLRLQVEALSAQHKLLRTLVELRDPSRILSTVLDSVAQHLRASAVVGVIDLLPEQGAFAHVAVRPDQDDPPGEDDARLAVASALSRLQQLSGRSPGTSLKRTQTPRSLPSGERHGVPAESPYLPVFVDRDLRGVLVVVRASALEREDEQLFTVWRDQLQDALTRAVRQRLDEQRRLELMVEAMDQGVVMTDERGTLTVLNPAARRLLAIEETERPDFAGVLQTLGLSSLELLRNFGPGSERGTVREVRAGESHWRVWCSPVNSHAGAFVGWLLLVTDVTEQKVAESRREEFVHIIGHELRSPLTSIGGVLDLLGKRVLGELSDRQREYVDMARDSCARINTNLNDLLDLAKFEKGRMPLALTAMNLERVVIDNARKFQALAIERGVTLEIDAPIQGLVCEGDPHRMAQVLNNLLSNAFKFTPQGGRISVAVHSPMSVPDTYLVAVRNTGEEIPEADLERIFDKFEQVVNADRRTVSGTGLGLPICRSIVEEHGGRIWAESSRADGTAFLFSVPANVPTGAASPSAGVEEKRHAAQRGEALPVLVVSQDAVEGAALKALLLREGWAVSHVRPQRGAIAKRLVGAHATLVVWLETDGAPDRDLVAEVAATPEAVIVALVPPGTSVDALVDVTVETPTDGSTLGGLLDLLSLRARQRRRRRVLVCDADPVRSALLAQWLDEAGYLAYVSATSEDARRRLEVLVPDLCVVDATFPRFAAAPSEIDAGAPSGSTDAAVLTLDDLAEVEAETSLGGSLGGSMGGASTTRRAPRPTSSRELLLLVRACLRRLDPQSPDLLLLPGPREVEREVQARLREGVPFAFCAVDVEGLRENVERRGFIWGHRVLSQTAELLRRMVRERGGEGAYLGHQRDDDFVLLVAPERAEAVARDIARAFARLLPVIQGEASAEPLRLKTTVVVDPGGRFDRYTTLQGKVDASRRRDTGDLVIVDSP